MEGNIGSGKSTFLKLLASLDWVATYQEPVEMWQHVGGQNLFQLQLSQPDRWLHTFQTYSTLTRVQTSYLASAPTSSKVSVMERSLFSERYCFVQMVKDSGALSLGEFSVLDKWFNMLTGRGDPGLEVDLIVYVKSDPGVLMDRIRARGRKGEEIISEDFLEEVHYRHQAWLEEGAFPLPAPVVILDGNHDLEVFRGLVQDWVSALPGLIERVRAGRTPAPVAPVSASVPVNVSAPVSASVSGPVSASGAPAASVTPGSSWISGARLGQGSSGE